MKLELQSGKREWAMTFPIQYLHAAGAGVPPLWQRETLKLSVHYKVVGPAANRQRDMTNLQQLLLGPLPNSPFSSFAFAAADSQTGDERRVRPNTSPYYIQYMVHSYLIINSNPENGFDKTFKQTKNYELTLLFRDIRINCCSIYTILFRAIVWSQSLTYVKINKIKENVHHQKCGEVH